MPTFDVCQSLNRTFDLCQCPRFDVCQWLTFDVCQRLTFDLCPWPTASDPTMIVG